MDSRRCLLCSHLNPCPVHDHDEQWAELRRNERAIREIRASEPPAGRAALEQKEGE